MKRKTLLITGAILLLSLLIPIPQPIFIILMGILLIAAVVFFLVTILRKKLSYSAPKLFSVLLIITAALELHFTKNIIIGRDYIVFGEQLAKVNYIVSFIILGLIFVLNLFFTINFIYKETIKFDPLTDMNTELFRIDGEEAYSETEKTEEKSGARKTANYYSQLQLAHRKLVAILVLTGILGIAQIISCFLKKYIILEPTIGNVVGFNLIIFLSTIILEITAFAAAKKYRKFHS